MVRKNKKTSRKKDSVGFLRRWLCGIDPERRKNFNRRIGLLILSAIVVGGSVVGLKYLEGYVREVNRQREVPLTVVLADEPAWAGEELIEQICLSSGVRSDDSLSDTSSLVSKWAENVGRNPWVKQLRHIRRCYDGRVVIDCELRQPIASVTKGGKVYYIDQEGVVLPWMPTYNRHMVCLRGDLSGLVQPGKCVDSQSLIAGLQVLTLILDVDRQLPRQERLWNQLSALDVGNYEGCIDRAQSHLTLYTKNNTEIRWGAAVGRERPYYEAPAKYKLASLYRAFKQYGSLDEYRYVELRDLRKEKSDPLRRG